MLRSTSIPSHKVRESVSQHYTGEKRENKIKNQKTDTYEHHLSEHKKYENLWTLNILNAGTVWDYTVNVVNFTSVALTAVLLIDYTQSI